MDYTKSGFYCGNSLELLQQMKEKSVNCIITSPPYFQLRRYNIKEIEWSDGWTGELGWEQTPDEFVNHLCDIFDECKRVLHDDGTLWVNIGDSYSGGSAVSMSERISKENKNVNAKLYSKKQVKSTVKFQSKSLIGIPFRFAVEMLNRGFILRNTIIWFKPNAAPFSSNDRFTADFEYIFFFVKKPKYHFEMQYEPFKSATVKRARGKFISDKKQVGGITAKGQKKWYDKVLSGEVEGRHKRCVWSISTSNTKEYHYATYPEELVKQMIAPGCPIGGIVLDPFSGSGTTVRVAEKMNRIGIGLDISQEYTDIAEKLFKEMTFKTKKYLKSLSDYY